MVQELMTRLEEACDAARKKWEKKEVPDDEVILLGKYSDFPREDFLRPIGHKIFVDAGSVFLVQIPSRSHEGISYKLAKVIDRAFELHGIILCGYGSTSVSIYPYCGCGGFYSKSPDFSLYLDENDYFPFIVGEVAVTNESFVQALRLAASWLGPLTGVEFCVIVKIHTRRRAFAAEILLCRRIFPILCVSEADQHDPLSSPEDAAKFVHKEKVEDMTSSAAISQSFGIEVVDRIQVTEENRQGPFELTFPLDPPVTVTLPNNLFSVVYRRYWGSSNQ